MMLAPTTSATIEKLSPAPASRLALGTASPTDVPTALSSPSPQTPLTTMGRMALTNADTGRTIVARLGDAIVVTLRGRRENAATWAWSTLTATNTAVLARTTAGTAPDGSSTAVFQAVESGESRITAELRCTQARSGSVCPHVAIPFQVTITIP